ncbi:zinc finger HIT domain-containing protein 3 [Chironomus tepperi]|uniref:zinc finger HIT domain-containing protein 3 n=1 Tax=Chironomus tepperi TaxID=113505 RepID=UPI00391F8F21
MTNCYVCEKEVSKYKCPACSIQYCSVSCFKTHKNGQRDELVKQNKSQDFENTVVEDRQPARVMFETIDTLPTQKLEELKDSEGLKELLKNKYLRDFLQELNEARNPWKAMKAAMSEPLFLEFADECLKVVENET